MKKLVTVLVGILLCSLASGQVCNVPITLTNSQSTATPDSFEQMVIVNSSLFSALEMSGLDNIEFTVGSPAPTGTVLQAWIESGNSSLSDSTVYWVNLADSVIPANGTLTIYMDFMGSAVLSATGPTGVAPDISTTYAQYDNGGLVFPNVYTRWGGLSGGDLPSAVNGDAINGGAITSISSPTYGTLSITNNPTNTQLIFGGSLYYYTYSYFQDTYGAYYATTPPSSYTYPTVLESKVDIACTYSWYGTGYGQQEEGFGALIANDNNNSAGPTYSIRSNWNLQPSFDCGAGSNSIADYTSLSETNPVANVWSILLNNNNGTDQITNVMYDYTQIPGQSFPITIDGNGATAYQPTCNGGLGTVYGYFGTFQNSPNTQPYETVYWTRTRAYPPAGIMPTATVDTLSISGGLAHILPLDTTICSGVPVTLTAVGGLSYSWSNNDTGRVITITPTSTTVLVVTATSGCGSATDTATITVDTSAKTLTVLPLNVTFCRGESATLYVSGGGFNFTWSPAVGLDTTSGDSVIANPIVSSTYTVTGTDSIGCSGTGTEPVTVIAPPNKPTITASVTGDTLFSSAQNGNQWFFNDMPINGATDSFLVISGGQKGWYYVEVTNVANGCSSVSDSTTGIAGLSLINNQLSIYPNPTSRTVFVKINSSADSKNWSLQVTDVLGRTLYTKPSLNYTNEVDLSNLPGGVYFITVENKTGRLVVPVVKE